MSNKHGFPVEKQHTIAGNGKKKTFPGGGPPDQPDFAPPLLYNQAP
jgi:hypothetical protein